jgi:uncharacterized protein (DUF302 family)
MASEEVRTVAVRRHVIDTDSPFVEVLDGLYAGIGQPDLPALFAKMAASATYAEYRELIADAAGGSGLLRFLHLDQGAALVKDPESGDQAGRKLVRILAGNPVTMTRMTRHVPGIGSYVPVTILVEERAGGGTRVSYDTVASSIAHYENADASAVADRLDAKVLDLVRRATGLTEARPV